jgi:hypothetical protein
VLARKGLLVELTCGGSYRVPTTEAMKKAGAEMGFSTPDVIVDGEVDRGRSTAPTRPDLADAHGPETEAEGFTRLT